MRKRKRFWLGLSLMAGLLTGCGAHLATPLTAGRQMPIGASRGGISIPLTHRSELQLNIRGFRLGLAPHTARRSNIDTQPEPMPWLRYQLHF